MFCCVLVVELHLPMSQSLKGKRALVKPVVDGARARFSVAAAETGFLDKWQRAELAFSAVAASPTHVEDVLDEVERFVWSKPDVEVVTSERRWVE